MHYPHSFYGVRQRWAFDEAKVSRARVLYTQHMRRGLPPPIFFVKCSDHTFMLERAECVAVGCRSAMSCSLPASLPPTSPILGIYCTTLTLHRPRTLTWWRDNDSHCLFFFLCPSPLQPFQPTSNKYCFFFLNTKRNRGYLSNSPVAPQNSFCRPTILPDDLVYDNQISPLAINSLPWDLDDLDEWEYSRAMMA